MMQDDGRAIRTNRDLALDVFCPRCKVQPGDPCVDNHGRPRGPLHDARHTRAVALGAPRNVHRGVTLA